MGVQAFGHSDAGSEAGDSFTSAVGDEQDLTGFAELADCTAKSGSPKRSPSRPLSATADVQPDLWREAQKLAAAGKVPVRKVPTALFPPRLPHQLELQWQFRALSRHPVTPRLLSLSALALSCLVWGSGMLS